MLWAFGQPAALAGLVVAFAVGVGLRAAVARLFTLRGDPVSTRFCPLGLVAACFSGTGWGRASPPPAGRRDRWAVAAGPLAVLIASQLAFAAYRRTFPGLGLPLRLYRPSELLRGVYAPTAGAEFVLSVAAGLLCFGLLALLPVPPFDGYRVLARVAPAWERLAAVGVLALLVVPVSGRPPLLTALDTVAGPLVRIWA